MNRLYIRRNCIISNTRHTLNSYLHAEIYFEFIRNLRHELED